MKLSIIPNKFAVCRLEPNREFPNWAVNNIFYSITRTADEISVVTLQNSVPLGVKSETDWRIIKVKGPLDFNLTGILYSLTKPLSEAKISIFAISTFDTDYLMVKNDDLDRTKEVLEKSGFAVNPG